MCFAFKLNGQLERYSIGQEDDIDRGCFAGASPPANVEPKPTSRKRAASLALEGPPKKVAKPSVDDVEDPSNNVIDVESSSASDEQDQSESASALQDLQEENAKLKEKFEDRNDDVHKWRNSTLGLRKEVEGLRDREAAWRMAKPLTIEDSKRLEAVIRQGFQTRLDKAIANHNRRVEKLKEAHKGALERQEAKNKTSLQHEKEHQKSKDKEHKDALAELKAAHKEEVAKLKPNHTKIVKEREQLEKEKGAEIAALKKEVNSLKGKEESLEESVDDFDRSLKAAERKIAFKDQQIDDLKSTLNEHLQDYRKMINLKAQWEENEGELQEKLAEMEAKEEEYKAGLEHEGKRWQLQYNKASNLERTIVEQQRSNADLRDSNERRTQQIKVLEVELQGAKRKIEDLESRNDELGSKSSEETLVVGVKEEEEEEEEEEGVEAKSFRSRVTRSAGV